MADIGSKQTHPSESKKKRKEGGMRKSEKSEKVCTLGEGGCGPFDCDWTGVMRARGRRFGLRQPIIRQERFPDGFTVQTSGLDAFRLLLVLLSIVFDEY